jgi:hypothetical protein
MKLLRLTSAKDEKSFLNRPANAAGTEKIRADNLAIISSYRSG